MGYPDIQPYKRSSDPMTGQEAIIEMMRMKDSIMEVWAALDADPTNSASNAADFLLLAFENINDALECF